jgi:hypothetical protein
MFIVTVLLIAALSLLLAVHALKKQESGKELKKVRTELKKKRVIYQMDSSV